MALQVSCDYEGCDRSGDSTGGFNHVTVTGDAGQTTSWWCYGHFAEVSTWLQGKFESGKHE